MISRFRIPFVTFPRACVSLWTKLWICRLQGVQRSQSVSYTESRLAPAASAPTPTEGATVKEQVTGWAVSVGSGLGAALAGAPWWAVVLVVVVVLGSTYGMVYALSRNPRIKRVSTFLMTVDTTEPELPPREEIH
jgi:hypothetical protein